MLPSVFPMKYVISADLLRASCALAYNSNKPIPANTTILRTTTNNSLASHHPADSNIILQPTGIYLQFPKGQDSGAKGDHHKLPQLATGHSNLQPPESH